MAKSTRPDTDAELQRRENLDFELLYLLEKHPSLSQREIAEKLGISLGKVNYCLKELAGRGAVKFANFREAKNKLRYVYVLTPQGISQRMAMTQRFLRRKMEEYERLRAQIETLEKELPGSARGPDNG